MAPTHTSHLCTYTTFWTTQGNKAFLLDAKRRIFHITNKKKETEIFKNLTMLNVER
jgi:hypothetical protein